MQNKKSIACFNLSVPIDLLDEAGIEPDSLIEMSAVKGKIIISVPDSTENFVCDNDCSCCPMERQRCANSRKMNVRCKNI